MLNMNKTRISFLLSPTLHQRLIIASKQEDKSLSELVREILEQELTRREQDRLEQTYEGLKAMDGVGESGISDASTTINEVLYGRSNNQKE
jgi:predicted DNA-binding protein